MDLSTMIAAGTISVEELANAPQLIERAQFVQNGVEACKKVLLFPLGVKEIQCYSYTDRAGEYHSWGTITHDGLFTCYCNWGGDHKIGSVGVTSYYRVFMALDDEKFASDLKRFLSEQIKKARA